MTGKKEGEDIALASFSILTSNHRLTSENYFP